MRLLRGAASIAALLTVAPMCSELITGPNGSEGATVTVQYISPMVGLDGNNKKVVELRPGTPITPVVAITVATAGGNAEPQPRARFAFKSIAAKPIVSIATTGTDLKVDSLIGVDTLTVSLVGTTIDSATANRAQDTVIVVALPTRVTVAAGTSLTALGATAEVKASLEDNATPTPNLLKGRVWFKSSDPSVVTVDSAGTYVTTGPDAGKYVTTMTAVANSGATPPQILTIVEGRDTTRTSVAVQQALASYVFSSNAGPLPSIGSKGDSVHILAQQRDALGQPLATQTQFQFVADKPTKLAVRALTGWAVALEGPDTIKVRIAGRDENQFPNEFIRVIVQQIAATINSPRVTGGQINLNALNVDSAISPIAIDRLGSTISLDATNFTYTSTNPAVATVDKEGVIHSVDVGSTTIRVVRDTASLTFGVTVTNIPKTISITPDPMTIRSINETVNATADVRNRAVPPGPVPGAVVNWSSLDPTVASVNASGQVTGLAVGTARIVGATQLGGALDTITVNVSNQAASIVLGLSSTTMASINDTLVVPITAKNGLGTTLPVTGVRWRSDDPTVVKVSIANDGTIIALKRGDARIIAENADGSVADTVAVTVSNAPASVVLNRTTDNLTALNLTLQYTAIISNARGGVITQGPSVDQNQITWRSTDGNVATIDANGLATAVGNGTALIIGETGSGSFATGLRADTATLTVSNSAVAAAVTPGSASITSVGNQQQLTASATNNVGGPVTGLTFTWTTSDAAVATVTSTGLVTATGTGTATITATSGTLQGTSTITVTNLPTFIDITLANITLASVNDFSTLAATLKNAAGATLPSTAATWTSDDPLIALVTSDGTVTAKAPGSTKVRAANPSNAAIKDSITVTVSNAAATVTLTPGTTQTLTSLGQTLNLSTTVLNQAGQPISNPTVTWDLVAGTSVSVATSGVGTGLVTALTNGTSTVRATSGSVSATVDVIVAQAISPSQSTVSAGSSTLTANGSSTTTITVQLKDANGNPYVRTPAATVVMTPSSGIPLTVTNNGSGNFTATHPAATTAGASTVSVTANGTSLSNTAIITFTPGSEALYVVTMSNATPIAGSPITISAQLKDANGNNVATSGKTVTWTSSNGGSFSGGGTSSTGPTGLATITFTTATTTTTHSVTATDNTAITGTSGAISTTAGAANKYVVSAGATSVAAGSSTTIIAQLTDVNGNPVGLAGQSVTWTGGTGGSFGTNPAVTSASGVATTTFTPSTTAGTVVTVTATDGASRTGTTPGSITTIAGAASKVVLTNSPDATPQSGTPFTTQPSLRLQDASSNNVSLANISVTASISSGTGTLGGITTVLTNGSGIATFTNLSISGSSGANTISFTSSGLTPASHVATITPGAATQMSVNAGNGQSTTVNTTVATAPSVLVRDAGGNPVSGVTVTFTVAGGGQINGGTAAVPVGTNGSGIAALASWQLGTTAGANTVTATSAGLSGNPITFTATGTAGAATQIASSGSPSTSSTVGTAVSTPPAVIVQDVFGNPVSGAPVTFTLTAAGGTGGAIAPGSPAVINTASNGIATLSAWTLGQTAGTNTVTATTTGVGTTITFNATGNAGAAQNMISASATSQSVPAGTNATAPSVIVRDAFNNPKSGISVTFATGGTGSIVGSPVTTLADGSATLTTWTTGTSAGTNTVTATVAGLLGSPITFTATGTAGTTTAGQSSVVVTGSTDVVADGVSSSTIVVTARDANNNPVSGKTISLDDAGNPSTISPASGTSNASGQVTFTVTSTTGGTPTYTATVTDGSAVVVAQTAQVTFHAGTNYLVTSSSSTPPAGTNVTITAQLRDAGNANVPQSGKTIVWSKLCNSIACGGGAAGGSFATPTSLTDATGKATVTLTVSNDASVNMTVTATDNDALTGTSGTIDVASGPAVKFIVTGGPGTLTAGGTQAVSIAAIDALGNPASSYAGSHSVTFSGATTAPDGTSIPTATSNVPSTVNFGTGTPITFNASGVGTTTLTLYKAETANIVATDGSITTTGSDRLTIAVSAAALNNFALALNSPQTDGIAFTGTNTLTARDQYHNTKTTFNASTDNVTFTTTLGAATTITGLGSGNNNILNQAGDFVSGVANLTGALKYTGTIGSGTFTATAASGPFGTSGSVTINVGAAQTFVLSAAGGNLTAGGTRTVTITAKDIGNNNATGYAGTKSLTFSGAALSPSGQSPTASNNAAADINFGTATNVDFTLGVATTDVKLYKVETANVSVTDGTVTTPSALAIAVIDAGANLFVVTGGPGTLTAGSTQAISIAALDQYRNPAASYSGSHSITFSGATTAPDGTSIPTATSNVPSTENFGTATPITFNGSGVGSSTLTLYKAETANIVATDGGITTTGSDRLTIAVSAAALNNFALALNSPQTDGIAFTGTNTLTARDQYHNAKTSFNASTDNVTFTTTLGAATTITGLGSGNNNILNQAGDFVSGVANLTGALKYTGTIGSGTFTATAASGPLGTSGSVTINVGAAQTFVLSAAGGNLTAGGTRTVTITAKDVGGNDATGYAGAKSLTFGGAAASPSGQNPTATDNVPADVNFGTATNVDFTLGVATTDVKLYKTQTANITATQAGVTTPSPLAITVIDAGANLFVVTGGPGTLTAGGTQTVSIAALDQYRNAAATYAGAHNITFSGANTAPDGTSIPTATDNTATPVNFNSATAITFDASGVGASDLTLYKVETANIVATDGGITTTGGDRQTIVVSSAAVSAAQSTVLPASQSVDGDGVATGSITVTLLDAFQNPVAGKTVSLNTSAHAGTLTTTPSNGGVSDASGVVTFTVSNDVPTDGSNTHGAEDVTYTGVGDSVTITSGTAVVHYQAVLTLFHTVVMQRLF